MLRMATHPAPQRPTIHQRLSWIEETLDLVVALLEGLSTQEELMAANQSAEASALDEAVAGLQAELADVSSVDGEVLVDLEGIAQAVGKVNPVTPEQVNAVTAVTSSLASLTAKLKAAGQVAATVEAGAGTEPAAGGEGEKPAVPTVSAISPVQGPAAGGGTATISGSGLEGAAVTFGPISANDVVVAEGGSSLTCEVPSAAAAGLDPGTGGTAKVSVTTPGGNAEATVTYTYEAAPAA